MVIFDLELMISILSVTMKIPSSMLEDSDPHPVQHSTYEISQEKLKHVDQLLGQHGFKSNSIQLMAFIEDAIRGREDAKFGFTKAVSLALKMIEQIGNDFGIARADMAFIDIHSLLRWDSSVSVDGLERWLQNQISKNKQVFMYEKALKFDIITEYTDIHMYQQRQANFVTKNRIISSWCVLMIIRARILVTRL